MKSVGSYEAKTHLAELLDMVARGERIAITRRGKRVAILVPAVEEREGVLPVVERMLEFRQQHGARLGKSLSVRELIDEGRKA